MGIQLCLFSLAKLLFCKLKKKVSGYSVHITYCLDTLEYEEWVTGRNVSKQGTQAYKIISLANVDDSAKLSNGFGGLL